jgi:hypothetical protein
MNEPIKIIDELEDLTNQIDLTNININQIKSNVNKLSSIYMELKIIWDSINVNKIKYKIYTKTNCKYNKIKSLLVSSFLSTNPNVKKSIINLAFLHCLKYSNIKFYWLGNTGSIDTNTYDYILALEMMKIIISLARYRYPNITDSIKRIIIWIPINKQRNFKYDQITQTNLKKSEDKFEAFVASGVTFGDNPRITIVTRYEEVEKLLAHELIHNFHFDGSNYHDQLASVINEYKLVKNNNKNNPNSDLKKNYDYEYSIYESYTELLSTYFYLLFKNISDNISYKQIQTKLQGQIIVELLYSYNLISNLASLNGYKSYEDFKNTLVFEGNICGFEYYFLKGLMYNNYELTIGMGLEDFKNIYQQIIKIVEKIKASDDILLNQIYQNKKNQKNFKYQIH